MQEFWYDRLIGINYKYLDSYVNKSWDAQEQSPLTPTKENSREKPKMLTS